MPGRDGIGPTGQGPMTGRGMGFCILKIDPHEPQRATGFVGVDGKRIAIPTKEGSAFAPPGRDFRRRSSSYGGQDGGYFAKEVREMPGGDGTGPAGMGPMTGRAAGYCAGYPVPGYANPIPGRGLGFRLRSGFAGGYGGQVGRGLGLGFRGGRGWGGYRGVPNAAPRVSQRRSSCSVYDALWGRAASVASRRAGGSDS